MSVEQLIALLQEQPPTATVLVRAEGIIDRDGRTDVFTDRAGRVRNTHLGTVVIEPTDPELPFGNGRGVKDSRGL